MQNGVFQLSQSVSQSVNLFSEKNSILASAKKTHKSITCRKKTSQ